MKLRHYFRASYSGDYHSSVRVICPRQNAGEILTFLKLGCIFLGAVMIFRRRWRDTNALRFERRTVTSLLHVEAVIVSVHLNFCTKSD